MYYFKLQNDGAFRTATILTQKLNHCRPTAALLQ